MSAARSGEPDPASRSAAPRRAVVVGATAWGTTLAVLLARSGVRTTLLARSDREAGVLQSARTNAQRLPGIAFPDLLDVQGDPSCLGDAELVCFAVPAQSVATNAQNIAAHVPEHAVLLSASKGIEISSGRRMTEVLAAALPGRPLAALSGPNLSREVAEGLPGSTVIAASDERSAWLREAFHSRTFRVYTSTDLIGVELGGALKNIIAIAAGMVDGLQYGDNAKAALITRGLAEMTRLGVASGADPLTFQGLAGVGDLVASSYSPLARNRRLGEWLGGGAPLAEALERLGDTAEGVPTTTAALQLAERMGVEMPIASVLQSVLSGDASPTDAVARLLGRDPRAELAGTPPSSR